MKALVQTSIINQNEPSSNENMTVIIVYLDRDVEQHLVKPGEIFPVIFDVNDRVEVTYRDENTVIVLEKPKA